MALILYSFCLGSCVRGVATCCSNNGPLTNHLPAFPSAPIPAFSSFGPQIIPNRENKLKQDSDVAVLSSKQWWIQNTFKCATDPKLT